MFLEKEFLKSVDRSKGKFRTFIIAARNHFLSKEERERLGAKKRGGNKVILSLDFTTAETEISREPADKTTPEKTLLQSWARTILGKASETLRKEYASRPDYLAVLDSYLTSQQGAKDATYDDIAKQFNPYRSY